MKKYFLWGYYGYGNLGDDLMLKNIIRRIVNKDPQAIIYVRCLNAPGEPRCIPVQIEKGRYSFLRPAIYLMKLIHILPKIDIMVIGGGTLFLDKGKHNFSMLLLVMVVFLAKLMRKEIYVTGAGIDILTYPLNLVYLRCILRNSGIAAFRDDYSYTMAKQLYPSGEIVKSSDIIFDASFVDSLTQENLCDSKHIVLSLTDYLNTWHESASQLFFEQSCSLTNMLLDHYSPRHTILLCAFQKTIGDRDYELLEAIRGFIIQKNPSWSENLKLELLQTEEQIRSIFSSALFTLGMRYHALVLSALFKKTFIGIDIEMKIKEICLEFNMPCVSIHDFLEKNINIEIIQSLASSSISKEVLNKHIELSELNYEWLEKS